MVVIIVLYPGNRTEHESSRLPDMDNLISKRHPSIMARARVAEPGQRRQLEGLVSKEFLGSNPIPRILHSVCILLNWYAVFWLIPSQ